jgi:hypothetical protein
MYIIYIYIYIKNMNSNHQWMTSPFSPVSAGGTAELPPAPLELQRQSSGQSESIGSFGSDLNGSLATLVNDSHVGKSYHLVMTNIAMV